MHAYIFFTHSSIKGYLEWYMICYVTNNTVKATVQVSLLYADFGSIYTRGTPLDQIVVHFFSF